MNIYNSTLSRDLILVLLIVIVAILGLFRLASRADAAGYATTARDSQAWADYNYNPPSYAWSQQPADWRSTK